MRKCALDKTYGDDEVVEKLPDVIDRRGTTSSSGYVESIIQSPENQSILNHRHLKKNGVFYTPPELADFLAQQVFGYLRKDNYDHKDSPKFINNDLRIIDPACGGGELITAIWKQLAKQKKYLSSNLNPTDILCGIDIDYSAVIQTRRKIISIAIREGYEGKHKLKVCKTNAIFPYNNPKSRKGWAQIKKAFNAVGGFDIVIANPPWGADVSRYKDKFKSGEYRLFQGQFDTADIFIENALHITKPGGYFAFIIPDSLFSFERANLRQLLLTSTQIKFLGRFGEKIFDKINRACALIICKCSLPKHDNMIECLRLNPDSRRKILAGTSSFLKEHKKLFHVVPQARFLSNRNCVFDIDLSAKEEVILDVFKKQPSVFGEHLVGSRGVELSKRGRICKCSQCNKWLPFPIAEQPKCPHCKNILTDLDQGVISIIQEIKSDGYKPLLVGQSISRYVLKQSLWLATNYKGINYKARNIYKSPKIVIRKTGVGISASLDYSNAYTNQVVYILSPKSHKQRFFPSLEFFLAVLNSRAIYYYVTKTYGEIEWRSHPYITQKQILSLPLPSPDVLKEKSFVIEKLGKMVEPYARKSVVPPLSVDAKIERLVAHLYGFNRKHYNEIYRTIDTVQELLPVRALKRITPKDIFSSIEV